MDFESKTVVYGMARYIPRSSKQAWEKKMCEYKVRLLAPITSRSGHTNLTANEEQKPATKNQPNQEIKYE